MAERRKKCIRCEELKIKTAFACDKRVGGRYPWCKACSSTYQKERRKLVVVGTDQSRECPVCGAPLGGTHKNRRYDKAECSNKAMKWAAYGLDVAEAKRLITARGERCPICDNKVRRWELDHSHKDGVVYGYVCGQCNHHLLAFSRHDPIVAKRLVAFLESPPAIGVLGEKRYVGEPGASQLHRIWLWTGKKPDDSKKP